jgi:hypothetical protein
MSDIKNPFSNPYGFFLFNMIYKTKPVITNDKPVANVIFVSFLRKNGIIRNNSPINKIQIPRFVREDFIVI